MLEIMPGIYKIEPGKITPSKYISFFVQRKEGNLLFPCLASASTFMPSWAEIHELGGVSKQLLGDMHFATKHNDVLFDEFGAKTYCSEIEEPDVRRKVRHVATFHFERTEIAPGVVAIPTPGHRPGAVSYLLESHGSRVLFVGDSIWHDGNSWAALASKKNRSTMKRTLESLCAEKFKTILTNSNVTNSVCHVDFNSLSKKNAFLTELGSAL